MKKYLFGILFGISCINQIYAALPEEFAGTNIVYFGDSLTDMGNFEATSPQTCVNVSAPVTNKTTGTQPGQLWSNNTASPENFVGEPAALPPGNPSNNDWAIAGAQTGKNVGTTNAQNEVSMASQVVNYLSTHTADPNRLYVLWAGSNDVIEDIFEARDVTTQLVTRVTNNGMINIFWSLDTLYKAGARNFLVIGLPDISKTPLSSNPTPNLELRIGLLYPAQTQVRQVCEAWNETLFSHDVTTAGQGPLAYFKAIHPDAAVYTWDAFALLDAVATDPAAFGYPDTVDGLPNNQASWCVNGTPNPQDPDNYIFFNYIHPTTRTHELIAEHVRSDSQLFTL